jgi:hypothetical protein
MPIPSSLAIHIENNISSIVVSEERFHDEQNDEFD